MGILNILCFGYIYFFVCDELGKVPKNVLKQLSWQIDEIRFALVKKKSVINWIAVADCDSMFLKVVEVGWTTD